MRIILTAFLLAASAVTTAVSITVLPIYDDKAEQPQPLVIVTAILWALFGLSIFALRGVRTRAAVVLIVAGSVAIGGAALLGPPNTSTDSARYAWDGIVQHAGISPYKYAPADPALTHLRTEWLFPKPVVGANGRPSCEGARIMAVAEPGTGNLICTAINRATVPTIYPPTSEIFFAGLRVFTPAAEQYWPMQLAGFVISLGVTLLLVRTLLRRQLDPRWAALWAWSPLVATEAITNSHIDVLGALLLFAATLAAASGRRWLAGIALGGAIATKLIPAIGTPALLRPGGWRMLIAAVVTFLALYVPYIVASGFGVLGYLPGYLTEEGYESGTRFIMLSLIAPGPAATVLAIAIIGVTAVLIWWKSDASNPWLGAVIMIGVTMLVVTPRYPWYALILLPMIAMTGRWEWALVPLALTERLLVPSIDLARLTVTAAIVVIVVMSIRRHRATRAPGPAMSKPFAVQNRT